MSRSDLRPCSPRVLLTSRPVAVAVAAVAAGLLACQRGPDAGGGPGRTPTGRFVDVALEQGIADWRPDTGEAGEPHGPGGLFTDLDGDGFPEVLLPGGPGQDSWLLRNLPDGAGGRRLQRVPFADATPFGATGAVAADYDNDGDVDVYVTRYRGPNQLWKNLLRETGALAFTEVTATTDPTPGVGDDQLGVGSASHGGVRLQHSMTAAWADVDRDGWADLYVGNHDGSSQGPGSRALPGQRDVLYRNLGDGTFRDVTLAAGVPGWSLSDGRTEDAHQHFASTNAVLFADLDGDGWPDLVVTNKTGTPADRDMVYRNRGVDAGGAWLGFEVASYRLTVGTTTPLAMGIDAGDVDGDGNLDLYLTDYAPRDSVVGPNELWLNQSRVGSIAFTQGEMAPGAFSWGTKFLDFDNDGRLDLHVVAGERLVGMLYRNTQAGLIEVAHDFGLDRAIDGRGDMAADLDGDGRVDLLVVALARPSSLFVNRVEGAASSLRVTLTGAPELPGRLRSTRDALGARVAVVADVDGDGRPERQVREVRSGDSNAASTSSLAQHFGLGVATTAEVWVAWPSGRRSETRLPVGPGTALQLTESAD